MARAAPRLVLPAQWNRTSKKICFDPLRGSDLKHQTALMPLDCRKRDFFITGDRSCWLLWVLQQILFHFSSITYRLCLTNKKTWIIHPINYINIYYRFFHIRGGGGWNSAQLTGFFPSRSHNTDRCWEICLSSVEYLAFHRASPLDYSFSIVYDIISYFYVTRTVLKDLPLFWNGRASLTILYLEYMAKQSVWDKLLIFCIF